MSPEQCTSSKVDHRSDIYSLGIVIYETLTGEVPFQHEELVRVMAMHLSDAPKPINEVRPDLHFPEALINIVQKTLLKNPNDRFQSMEELSLALEESLKEPDAKGPQHVTQSVHKDMAPGPLAQDDALQHRKESREMIPARPQSTRDLAVNALDDMGTRTAGGNFQEQVAAYRDSQKHADHTTAKPVSAQSFNAGRQKGGGGLAGLVRVLVPLVLTVAVLGAAVVFAMKQGMLTSIPGMTKVTDTLDSKSDDPDKLFRSGKYAQAIGIWRPLKAKGALTADQTDKYYTCCVNVGRQYLKDKKYSEATTILKEVPSKASSYRDAKDLIRKVKRAQK
jgi:serine/threonine protein kinase